MSDVEDWLQDPLIEIGKGSYESHKLKSLDEKQYNLWRSFHFSTRLKLDAADYFCRQVLGAASMPFTLGLPLLAHRQLKWYLDVFFFELMSAYNTLLQELNIVYDLGLKPDKVYRKTITGKLPERLAENIEKEWRKEWFTKVRRYRNMATHHSYLWTGSQQAGSGEQPWDYDKYKVFIHYLDNAGKLKGEEISVCPDYLKKVVEHIYQVWKEMAQEFQ